MERLQDRCITILREISRYLTAPYHEFYVSRYITSELDRLQLPHAQDEYGNIIATYDRSSSDDRPGMALVAHMDHPGFEIVGSDGPMLLGRLLGGIKKEFFDKPVPVRVFSSLPDARYPEDGIPGRVVAVRPEEEKAVTLEIELAAEPPGHAFGMWGFTPFELRDGLAYMRAVDDPVGCAVILMTLELLIERNADCRCMAVFTRAEEVGMVGAKTVAEQGLIRKTDIVVSLETSKALPGAEIGAGPVIRVGDRSQTFDNHAESVLRAARDSLLRSDPDIRIQRQLMSGGACEASLFVLEGYRTTAMALPLGNYHNMAPDGTLQPEYIHPADMATCVRLLVEATAFLGTDTLSQPHEDFGRRLDSACERLRETRAFWRDTP